MLPEVSLKQLFRGRESAKQMCPGQGRAVLGVGRGGRRGRNPRVLREGLFSGRWVKEVQIRPGVRSRSCQGDLKARRKE